MQTMESASALMAGLALGAASILSVGPNNLMLAREGLVGGRVAYVATLVWLSYFVLLTTALCLTDAIASHLSPLRTALSWLGLAAIFWFACLSFRAAFGSKGAARAVGHRQETSRDCLRRVMMVVWFNPLTYVELLLIPAAMSGNYAHQSLRVSFVFGLMLMAGLCCYGYGYGGRFVSGLFRDQRTLRSFDLASGLLLTLVACLLLSSLAGEVRATPARQRQTVASEQASAHRTRAANPFGALSR